MQQDPAETGNRCTEPKATFFSHLSQGHARLRPGAVPARSSAELCDRPLELLPQRGEQHSHQRPAIPAHLWTHLGLERSLSGEGRCQRAFPQRSVPPAPTRQGRQVKSEEDRDRFCLFQLGSPTLALFHLAKAALNLSRPVYLTVDVLSLKPNYLLKSIKGEKNPIGI